MKKGISVLTSCSLMLALLAGTYAQKPSQGKAAKKVAVPTSVQVKPRSSNLADAVNDKRSSKSASAPLTGVNAKDGAVSLREAGSMQLLDVRSAAPASSTQHQGVLSSVIASGNEAPGSGAASPRIATGPIYSQIPALTKEQIDQMEEKLDEVNPPIRVPQGENIKVVDTPISPASEAPIAAGDVLNRNFTRSVDRKNVSGLAPSAANDFVYGTVRDVPTSAAVSRSAINEPSVANIGDTVFFTGNWYAAISTNGGTSFSYVSPSTTLLPSVNGGFCCDQLANYAPNQNMLMWAVQYTKDSNSGTLRLARAVGSTAVANNQWVFYDFNPQQFGFPAGDWMDFPGMTVGSTYVYLTSNVFNQSDRNEGSVVWRIPLSELAAGGTINYSYLKRTDNYSPKTTEGAGTTMYWATHLSTSRIRIFRWDDGPGNVFWDDININSYAWLNRDGIATSADGTNWAARADSRLAGGWVANNIIGFMWAAKQDSNFPYPYTIVARFNQSNRALVSQNQIWNSQFAWLYPTASVNAAGNLAGLVSFGGGPHYPGTAIWISDDVQNGFNPLAVYGATQSGSGPTRNVWGDYQTVHRHSNNPNTWVSSTYYLQGGGENSNAVPRYLWFGRERDFSCTFSISPTSQSFSSSGGTGTVTVTASSGACNRTAITNNDWLMITSGSTGAGNGSVGFSVAPNPTSSARSGTLTVAGRTFTVNQAASSCSYSISPSSNSIAAGGGSGTVSVTAGAGCGWTAISNNSFITVTSGSSGSGNGVVGYSVAPNSASVGRVGTITIAGRTFTVNQAGVSSCTQNSISVGQTVGGTLSTSDCTLTDGSYYDTYVFSGTAGQQIVVEMSSFSFDTYLFLLAPDGSVLAVDDDGGGGTNSRIPNSGNFSLPTTGTYRILANSYFPGATGSYNLTLSAGFNCTNTPISIGQTVGGSLSTADCYLNDGSYYDTYSFNGTSGQSIVIGMSSSAFDTYLFLIAPDGSVLASDDDGGAGVDSRIPADVGALTLPSSGIYTILANSYSGGVTGGYTVTLSSTIRLATAGLFNPATSAFFLRNSNSSGVADISFAYGPAGSGWTPLVGDWNGDGVDTIGLYNPASGAFFLRNSNSTGVADISFAYGPGGAGWLPLVGDWNGDGTDSVGLYNPSSSAFFLRNSNSSGVADISFAYGPTGAGWVPIVGDWNGDGTTTVGLYNPSAGAFFLRNSNSTGVADVSFSYGPSGAGWLALVGDWNGDGTTTIGLYNPSAGAFFLRNTNSSGVADTAFSYGPAGAGWRPLIGDWIG